MDILWIVLIVFVATLLPIILYFVRCEVRLRRNQNTQPVPWWFVFAWIPTIISMVVGLVVLFILAIYRFFICRYLKVKHGNRFGGLLNGLDAYHMTSDREDHVINSLLIFQCTDAVTPDVFYANMRDVVLTLQQRTKFNSKFYTHLGYSYMLKNQLRIDNCLSSMEIIENAQHKLSKAELAALLNQHFNRNLPQLHAVPWEIVVGKQTVDWEDARLNYFPVLFRCKHGIADSATLMQVLVSVLNERGALNRQQYRRRINYLRKIIKFISFSILTIYRFFLISTSFAANYFLRGNISLRRPLNVVKEFVFSFREVNSNIARIRHFKEVHNGAHVFPDMTDMTEYTTMAISTLFGCRDIFRTRPANIPFEKVIIENNYSFLMLRFPFRILQGGIPITDIFAKNSLIERELKNLRTFNDYYIMHSFIKCLSSFLPRFLLRMFLDRMRCTAKIIILHGPPKLNCWQETAILSNVIMFTPTDNIATTVTVNSHNGKLHIGTYVRAENADEQINMVENLANSVLSFIDVFEDTFTLMDRDQLFESNLTGFQSLCY